jgi:hypothetical protein
MAQPIGPANDQPDAASRRGLSQPKKKGCKKTKCSNWKGGKCRCGKD